MPRLPSACWFCWPALYSSGTRPRRPRILWRTSMRKVISIVAALGIAASLSACQKNGYERVRPDEFAVVRAQPLVIPPDFALVPPQPGTARPQDGSAQNQALDAMFGGSAIRSASENSTLDAAGRTGADQG